MTWFSSSYPFYIECHLSLATYIDVRLSQPMKFSLSGIDERASNLAEIKFEQLLKFVMFAIYVILPNSTDDKLTQLENEFDPAMLVSLLPTTEVSDEQSEKHYAGTVLTSARSIDSRPVQKLNAFVSSCFRDVQFIELRP